MESVLNMLLTLFQIYVVQKWMKMFLGPATKEKKYVYAAYLFRVILCAAQYAYFPYVILNMLASTSTLFLITLCYGGKLSNKLITTVLISLCLFVSEMVVVSVMVMNGGTLNVNGHNGNSVSYLGVAIVLWMIYQITIIFKGINMRIVIPKSFNIIVIILSGLIFFMETDIFLMENIRDSVKVVSVVMVLIIWFLIIYLYDLISKHYVEKMQAEFIEREKNAYFKQVELLQHSGKAMRDFRHDMNNHLYTPFLKVR